MRVDQLDPAALRRLQSAWLDPEVDRSELIRRFSLSDSDPTVAAIVKLFGPRPKPISVTDIFRDYSSRPAAVRAFVKTRGQR